MNDEERRGGGGTGRSGGRGNRGQDVCMKEYCSMGVSGSSVYVTVFVPASCLYDTVSNLALLYLPHCPFF